MRVSPPRRPYIRKPSSLSPPSSPPEASWHTDYRDTAYVHIGGLPFTASEGDILTIFSQFGSPTYLHLARDKESGKSRGFAWLKYEDQRSTDLAVDNLGGATILGRTIRVDHARYKRKDGEDEEEERRRNLVDEDVNGQGGGEEAVDVDDGEEEEKRDLLPEEIQLAKLVREHDDDDPMKEYLVQEKREEVATALKKFEKEKSRRERHGREDRKRHHHRHRRHRSRSKERSRDRERDRERGDRDKEQPRRRSRSQERRKRYDYDDDINRRERSDRKSHHRRSGSP